MLVHSHSANPLASIVNEQFSSQAPVYSYDILFKRCGVVCVCMCLLSLIPGPIPDLGMTSLLYVREYVHVYTDLLCIKSS